MNDKRKLYKKCGWISVGVSAFFLISLNVIEARGRQVGWFSEEAEAERLWELSNAAEIGGIVFLGVAVICFLASLICKIKHSTRKATEEKRERNLETSLGVEGTLPNGMIYKVDGVRGRQLEVYKDRCVLRVTVTAGSLITGNYSDGEKTIYYADCVGVQFKESGIQIGYLQLETATGLMNNRGDNFFNENSFTFDESVVTNAKMREIANYVRERISEAMDLHNTAFAWGNRQNLN